MIFISARKDLMRFSVVARGIAADYQCGVAGLRGGGGGAVFGNAAGSQGTVDHE